ncbi:hypothetical protein BpHYR1_011084 [Brachionus plicatilis]|uniref:Uncharacterized protein n=1 Tax=Brachionus plicatilis TaxID=10195 RepID=A0A3M7RXZ1_BRAPC|nr:hypothetical protein BpHYR1_011084 [Brachionus plicatilis]
MLEVVFSNDLNEKNLILHTSLFVHSALLLIEVIGTSVSSSFKSTIYAIRFGRNRSFDFEYSIYISADVYFLNANGVSRDLFRAAARAAVCVFVFLSQVSHHLLQTAALLAYFALLFSATRHTKTRSDCSITTASPNHLSVDGHSLMELVDLQNCCLKLIILINNNKFLKCLSFNLWIALKCDLQSIQKILPLKIRIKQKQKTLNQKGNLTTQKYSFRSLAWFHSIYEKLIRKLNI